MVKFNRTETIIIVCVCVFAIADIADSISIRHRLAPITKQLDVAEAQKQMADIQGSLIKRYPDLAATPAAVAPPTPPPQQPSISTVPAATPVSTSTPTPTPTPTPIPAPPISP